jgi:Phage Single-stranded DNA-binding protein
MDLPLERSLMARCAKNADFSSDETINQEIAVEHVLCHLVTLVSEEDGEETQAVRTVLVSPTGETFGFVSKGVFDSLSWIGFEAGPPPWDPAIKVRLTRQQTRGKRSILLLELVR